MSDVGYSSRVGCRDFTVFEHTDGVDSVRYWSLESSGYFSPRQRVPEERAEVYVHSTGHWKAMDSMAKGYG